MDITKELIENMVVLRVNGRLDAYTSIDLENAINEVIASENTNILINFQEIDYISSSGLRVMLSTMKKIKQINGNLKLTNLKPYVKEVFDIAGFTQLFEIYENENEAFESFKRN